MELVIPAMKSEACAKIVYDAISLLGLGPDGAIREIRMEVGERKAWVLYNNVRLGKRNIEVAVRHAGFDVNDLAAAEDARAKLPPDCRHHD